MLDQKIVLIITSSLTILWIVFNLVNQSINWSKEQWATFLLVVAGVISGASALIVWLKNKEVKNDAYSILSTNATKTYSNNEQDDDLQSSTKSSILLPQANQDTLVSTTKNTMYKLIQFWVNPTKSVFFSSCILCLIGFINIHSASFYMATEIYNDGYFYVKRHFIYFVIGVVLMTFAARIDYRRISQRGLLFFALMTTLLLVMVHFVGLNVNGARRFLKIGFFTFQPSEIAKLAVVMISAVYLGGRLDQPSRISLNSWPIYLAVLMAGLVLKQPDMSAAVLIIVLGILMYIVAGISRGESLMLSLIGMWIGWYSVYGYGYRSQRILNWLDPWAYQWSSGYQIVQSLLAIASGGFVGIGPGIAISAYFYLPEAHTDFAFAILCQKMGFVGAVVVCILYVILAWQGMRITISAPDGFGTMLAAGISALLVIQSLSNMAMVCGLLPQNSFLLPFISYGGTSLIINLIAVGFLISVGRRGGHKI